MQTQFLVLTTPEGDEVLVGIANIAFIETNPDNPNQTAIRLNFVPHKDGVPRTIYVKQDLDLIKSLLGIR